MAVATMQDLVGLVAFSRDGTKVGKIKSVIGDDSSSEYLVVGRLLHSLVVPADVVEQTGDHVVIPFGSAYLDMSPAVKSKDAVSAEERSRLRDFYHVHETA